MGATEIRKILIVEDEPSIAELMQTHAETFGYSADTVLNGDEGLENLSRNDYRVVVTDMNYGEMKGPEVRDGVDLGLRIAVKSRGTTPVILTSGTMQDLEKFLARYGMTREQGDRLFCAYLSKPLTRKDFRHALDKAESFIAQLQPR